jgi:molybdopterin biosynthesis enzyme MoaB
MLTITVSSTYHGEGKSILLQALTEYLEQHGLNVRVDETAMRDDIQYGSQLTEAVQGLGTISLREDNIARVDLLQE